MAVTGRAVEQLEARQLMTGTWSTLTNNSPSTIGTMMLLSDGTVMAHGGGSGSASNAWYKLTPSATGSYAAGTWSTLATAPQYRLYYGSAVLTDGRVFVLGGEYSGPSTTANWINTGEIYNPATNAWTAIANFPQSQFGDDPVEVLPNGNVLAGYLSGPQTYIYNVAANTWSAAGTKLSNDRSDEETWIKMADGSILSYDIFAGPNAQKYSPTTNTWTSAGAAPTNLHTPSGFELGPGFLLPDGRAFQVGGISANALYTPATNTWAAAPTTPAGLGGNDSPGAVLTNGKVLFVVGDTSTSFNPPSTFYEYDYTTNALTAVTAPTGGATLGVQPFTTRMLDLPNGQVLFSAGVSGGSKLYLYTPDGAPQAAWLPTVSNIVNNGDNTFTLSGTKLNGMSEGASYGDDALMASNYPIVKVSNGAGTAVKYLKTYNWSSVGVQTGATVVTTQVSLPSGTNPSAYLLTTSANGLISQGVLNVQVGTLTTNNVTLRVDPGNPANVQVLAGVSVLDTFPLSSFNQVIISGNSTGDTITLGSVLAGKTITVNGGAGNDNVILQSNSLLATLTLKLGTGADTVTLSTDVFNVSTNFGNAGASVSAVVNLGATAKFLVAQTLASLNTTAGTQTTVSAAVSLAAASSLAGSTTLTTGTLTANAAVTNTGAILINGGTANFNTSYTQTAGSITFGSGFISSATPLAISGGSYVGNANPQGLSLNMSGASTAQINTTSRFGSLALSGTAKAQITTGHLTVLELAALTVGATATLDMGDGAAIVRNGNLVTLNALAASGINLAGAQLWTGPGITSSLAAAEISPVHGVGVISNTLDGGQLYTSFHGITATGTDVLIAYTLFGDADLSGVVDDTDYFLANDGLGGHKTGWVHGDFDYSGLIDDTDFFLLNTGFSA